MSNEKKKEPCPCEEFNCPRHGNCSECRAKHYNEGSKPKCER